MTDGTTPLRSKSASIIHYDNGRDRMVQKTGESIFRGLRGGLSLSQAAERVGIRSETVRNWFLKGERGLDGYKTFYNGVMRAKPVSILKMNEVVMDQANNGDWRAADRMVDKINQSMERYSEDIHSQMTEADKVRLALSHPTLGPIFRRMVLDDLKTEAGLPTEMEQILFAGKKDVLEVEAEDVDE